MANQQINQYTIERLEFGDDDYYDIDYWNGSAYQTAKIKGSVIKGGMAPGLFAQTDDGTAVENTTTETSLLGSGVGSLLIPADSWIKGQSYHFQVTGVINANVNDAVHIRLKTGATQLLSGGSSTLFAITGGKYFQYDIYFTCREIGGPGVGILEGTGTFGRKVDTSSQYRVTSINDTNNTTFTTTGNNTLDITAEWSVADPNNRIQSRTAILKRIY